VLQKKAEASNVDIFLVYRT